MEAVARQRVREPGLLPRIPGLQRYHVPPGGSVVITLGPGDELRITDREGNSECRFEVLEGALAGISGITDLFGAWSPAGAVEVFRAESDCRVVIASPDRMMQPDEHVPPSAFLIEVQRAVVPTDPVSCLPEPLALPMLLDLRIDRATATSYEVGEGQWIQIIDVEGRQCSDLLAFNARHLQNGKERGIDPTVTRTLLGALYPWPGLASKYYDQDMQPLLEVVRDTVGRHDTFGLACTAKYYEDMGYPGHVSCSENFNVVLDGFGIEARRGWPAINLWYNTMLVGDSITLDEPESRPGDYVLLRALDDLVVASSACPDDIDPTNAWNPTDIHVRVYDASRTFTKAMAHRVTPEAEPTLTKETGFAPSWGALTRRVTEYRGYWLPTSFSGEGAIAEYWACRERAAIIDLSPLRKFEVTGPDAEALLQCALTRDVKKLSVGQVVYSAMCSPTGGMIDDGTLFRLGPDLFRWIGGDEFGGAWLRQLALEREMKAWVKHSTDQLHNVAVQGPASRNIVREAVWTPPGQPSIDELGWFGFTIGRLGDFNGPALLVSRTGYSGELGFEVFCHPSQATAVWDALWNAGEGHGLAPLGLDALDVLRIEAGLAFSGYEFDNTIDPFEAGIGFTVALNKGRPADNPDHPGDEFIGRHALARQKASRNRVLVGLELNGNEVANHGDCVHVGRPQIGVVTSGCRSPWLGASIALARVAPEYASIGTEVEVGKIDGHQKRLPARVVRFPFYDPDKTKPRS
jgi:aminomethyltransferase